MLSDAEILSQFRDYVARQGTGPEKFEPLRNHPNHRGVIDAAYVRPAPTEFPKCVYHISGITKIVHSREEQDALGAAYSETPAKRSADWREKLNEVYTRSGFRVFGHHLEFLKGNEVSVETLKEASEFLDSLDDKQQEAFFQEAEQQTEKPKEEASKAIRKSKAA